MKIWKAEIIAIGDEISSGQRLDTNSQWLAEQLCASGVEARFHTTVGDDLADGIDAFKTAVRRSDLVLSTGGIGPTEDDLTRQVIAAVASVPLIFRAEVMNHIRGIYQRLNREMPESNQHQAWFPEGSNVVPNREGTAPGIDINVSGRNRSARIFALPGVPYEMKEMWKEYVQPAIIQIAGQHQVIRHHVVHCFGAGESQIEKMLDGLTDRHRKPRVGITASKATISLRITATGRNDDECLKLIQPTRATIHERLGDLVFGENGTELQDVLVQMLKQRSQSIALVDYGFGGDSGQAIFNSDADRQVYKTSVVLANQAIQDWLGPSSDTVRDSAIRIRSDAGSEIGVAISCPERVGLGRTATYQVAIAQSEAVKKYSLDYAGHSGLRMARTTKQILNQIRLHLMRY